MREILLALGRSLVKVLVSLFVGTGVGLFLFGYYSRGMPAILETRNIPPEFFLSLGAGLLSAGGMLLLLFGISWLRGRPRQQEPREQRFPEQPGPGAT